MDRSLEELALKEKTDKAAGTIPAYGYLVVAVGSLIFLINGSTAPVVSVLLKPVVEEFGWRQADAVLGYSLSFLVTGILGVVMGRLTDKLGPRIVVAVFGSFLGIANLFLSQAQSLWQFQLYYALFIGLGSSALVTPVIATIARCFDQRRGFMMGITQSGVGFSGLAFAPLAAWIAMNEGWRWAYGVIGILCLASTILGGLCLRQRRIEGEPSAADGGAAAPPSRPDTAGGWLWLREVCATSRFWIIAALFMGFGFCRSGFITFTAPLVLLKGFTLADGANVVAALTIASISGRLLMGRIADGIGNRRTLMISEGLTCIAFVLAPVVEDLAGLYLYAIVFGIGWGGQAVLRHTLCAEAFGLASIGLVMGVLHLVETIGASLGLYLTGHLFDLTGSYTPAFLVGLAISLIGLALSSLRKA